MLKTVFQDFPGLTKTKFHDFPGLKNTLSRPVSSTSGVQSGVQKI